MPDCWNDGINHRILTINEALLDATVAFGTVEVDAGLVGGLALPSTWSSS